MPVCTVLVNYKNAELTIRCLHALEHGTIKPDRIYVVDNGTSSESQDNFKAEVFSSPIQFIWNERNIGFAPACNLGATKAIKDGFHGYIWFLNNDTEPSEAALEKLLEKATESQAGITGSLIVNEQNRYIGGVGLTHSKFASVSRPSAPQRGNIPHFDYVEGSSFLISPDCIKTIGLLCEDFFLYFEESDYCFRAKKAGFTLAWATESIVVHRIGSSTGSETAKGKVPFFIDCLMIRNRIHFARRNNFPSIGIWIGFLISLALRVKRLQFKRVLKIIEITISSKRLKKFIEENGGYYEIQD